MVNLVERHITKVKYEGSKVHIEYEVVKDNGIDEFSLTCREEPRPEFKAALDGLAPTVAEGIEIPELTDAKGLKKYVKTLEVRGVSFSYSNGIMGAVITALKTLENCNSPLVINTPHKPSSPYSQGDPSAEDKCLSPAAVKELKKLQEEAEKYIAGERAQGEMFKDNNDGKDGKKKK